MAKIERTVVPVSVRIWSNGNSHTLLVELENGMMILEDGLAVFFYTEIKA